MPSTLPKYSGLITQSQLEILTKFCQINNCSKSKVIGLLLEQWSKAKCPKLSEENLTIDTDEVSHQVMNQVTNLLATQVNDLVANQVTNLIKDEVTNQLATNNQDATQDANQFLTDVNFIKEVAYLVSKQLATNNQVTTQVTNQNANQLNLFSGKSENAVAGSGGLCPISTKEEEETPAPATVAEPEPLDNSDSSDKIISVSGKVNDETLTESELKQLPSENELIDEEKAEGIITSEGKKEAITGDSEGANLKPLPQEFLDLPKGKLTATKISKTLEVSNGTVTNWANKKQKPHYGPCVERGRKTAVSV